MKKDVVLSIKGLHCANCAGKIEKKLNELENVEDLVVDFLGEKILFQFNEKNEETLDNFINKIEKIADNIEKGVKISLYTKAKKNNIQKESCCSSGKCESTQLHSHNIYENRDLGGHLHEIINEKEYAIVHGHTHKHSHGDYEHTHFHIHDEEHSHDHKDNKNEFLGDIKGIFTKIALGGLLFFLAIIIKFSIELKLIFYVLSYVIIGGEVVLTAFRNIKKGNLFDENFLMTVATGGAFIIGEYPEAVAVMLFYQIGELFQEMAVSNSKKSISSLMDIRPDYANLEKNGSVQKVSPEEVEINDVIIVKAGEKVPLDGVIIEGNTTFDTSALTGESLPRENSVGDKVLSGYINRTGLIKIKVTKIFEESTVSKILDLVENSTSKKSKTEKFITKFARYYTPLVVGVAIMLALLPPLFIEGATFANWIYRALVFLVVSCPCALVISIPLGFFGGIGGASKQGILIKGGNYLEALQNVDTIVFDKTGTLTKGIFKVVEIKNYNGYNVEDILKYAAHAEKYSNHPIAKSIVEHYLQKGNEINESLVQSFEEKSGLGIKVLIDNKNIFVGNVKLMEKEGIKIENNNSLGTVVYVAIDGNYAGNIVISDEIKEDSVNTIKNLTKLGIKNIVMLTGDNKKIAEKIGEKLGINKVFSELLPGDKVEKLEKIFEEKKEKGKVVFVGDGINDAPVLARADVGIAMGGLGSDAAIEAADVVIMTDEPSKIVNAIKLAYKTKKIVWQNIILALGVKLIVLFLGAGGHATMWEAVFADVGVAIIAILNSMRAMRE